MEENKVHMESLSKAKQEMGFFSLRITCFPQLHNVFVFLGDWRSGSLTSFIGWCDFKNVWKLI